MVRFIIRFVNFTPAHFDRIYIPLWLDLLLCSPIFVKFRLKDLHSTMVRFIMNANREIKILEELFTFHYG